MLKNIVLLQYVSALRPPKKKTPSRINVYANSEHFHEMINCKNTTGSLTFPKPFGARESFQRRSLQDFSSTVARTLGEEFEVRRRQAEFSLSSFSKSHRILSSALSSDSEPESSEFTDTGNDEWKQVGFICAIVHTVVQPFWPPLSIIFNGPVIFPVFQNADF